MAYNVNRMYKTLDYWSWGMLNFDLLEKGLGVGPAPHFTYDFQEFVFSFYSLLTD